MTAAILATILFSLSAVSGKRLSHHLSGVEANFWRFLLAAALLGVYAHSMGAGLGGGALLAPSALAAELHRLDSRGGEPVSEVWSDSSAESLELLLAAKLQ